MRFAYTISTFFNIGYFNFAPGTLASLVTMLMWLFIIPENNIIQLASLIFIIIIGFYAVNTIISSCDEEDPSLLLLMRLLE